MHILGVRYSSGGYLRHASRKTPELAPWDAFIIKDIDVSLKYKVSEKDEEGYSEK
ncbi:uncharacterized protein BO97DRAFT_408152 [Aspergillus homomorphus CBS 101889]|uniref:Uncharacterized protein n=1 Tax=Aspergillus homomorphus (strain CBS 101889) TaxID=1450537 RepID=A0A395HLQ6_ASPHC|nr:hypothetical protein BO97DRAFT_408152 [Aspergillus homomorphus CBS 101889]RAL08787.1 hypothetical protein BO97DRAFT_408152 [Aspergillus homomorphus CBS 101889]